VLSHLTGGGPGPIWAGASAALMAYGGTVTRGWGEEDRVRVRARLCGLAGTLPGAGTDDAHGHTGYLLRGKRFAWLLVDHHGDGRLALWVKAPPGEQDALVSSDARRYFVPRTWARRAGSG
jgi:hypothetical protein